MAYLRAVDASRPGGSWRLVRTDGTRAPIPDGGFTSFARMGEGVVGISADGERPAAIVLDASGKAVRRTAARGYGLAASPDGRVVAWLGATGAPQVLEGGGSRTFDLPKVPQAGSDVGAILGGACRGSESPAKGCGVVVNSADSSQVWFSTSDGFVDVVRGRSMKSVVDASLEGSLVGLTSLTDAGSCSGVWTNVPRPVWQTCDFTLTEFSPDGSRLLGTDPYLDGLGQRTLAFLYEGSVLRQFESPKGGPTIIQATWEDDDHALAVVVEREQWSVLRLGVDGSMEYAVEPVAGDEVTRPFVLPESWGDRRATV